MPTRAIPLLLLCLVSACNGVNLHDDPGPAFSKTDRQMTAPPPELRDGSARETGARSLGR